jgi:hypothetical protein
VLCATTRDGDDANDWARREVLRMTVLRDGAATGSADRPALDLFWRRLVDGEFSPVEPPGSADERPDGRAGAEDMRPSLA